MFTLNTLFELSALREITTRLPSSLHIGLTSQRMPIRLLPQLLLRRNFGSHCSAKNYWTVYFLLYFFHPVCLAPSSLDKPRPKALVYHNRVAHTSRTRYIAYRRLKIEGRPHAIAAEHVEVVHATIEVHTERIARIVRKTGNGPFIKTHIHPIIICGCCIIIWTHC